MTDNVETKKREKKQTTALIEIYNEDGTLMKIKPEQVKVLAIFQKINDDIFKVFEEHRDCIRIKF